MFSHFDSKNKKIFCIAPHFLFFPFVYGFCLYNESILSILWELNHVSGLEICFFKYNFHCNNAKHHERARSIFRGTFLQICKILSEHFCVSSVVSDQLKEQELLSILKTEKFKCLRFREKTAFWKKWSILQNLQFR